MKITVESTTKIVEIRAHETTSWEDKIHCRVWEGETERGVKVQCLIPRIAALEGKDLKQFESELQEQKAPSADVEAFPMRMIL